MKGKKLNMVFVANLERVMSEKGINAAQLARMANLNPTGIYDILKHKSSNPRIDTLERIADALNVSVASLLGEPIEQDLTDQIMRRLSALPPEDLRKILLMVAAWSD